MLSLMGPQAPRYSCKKNPSAHHAAVVSAAWDSVGNLLARRADARRLSQTKVVGFEGFLQKKDGLCRKDDRDLIPTVARERRTRSQVISSYLAQPVRSDPTLSDSSRVRMKPQASAETSSLSHGFTIEKKRRSSRPPARSCARRI
jgi:hypothetical protein